ncbi:MAG TPA: hypothetical protein VM534_04310 [Thermoanaerobaculia bacterium]|nr:hypothetical protein [Thermoanaerobaculia bacterium]
MRCEDFREAIAGGEQGAPVLAHVRACADCLEMAVSVDPDMLFRSLGGDQRLPSGGVDAFVAGVMQQVHLRETEQKMAEAPRPMRPLARWAVAASLALALLSGLVAVRQSQREKTQLTSPVEVVATVPQPVFEEMPMTLPVVEHYDSPDATIVSIPAQSKDDLEIVMIFDESLPVNL